MSKYIVITGGQMFNKGAEAMVYLAVSELKEKYPDAKIVVLSTPDYQRPKEEKEKYNFELLPRESRVLFSLTSGSLKRKGHINQVKAVLKRRNAYIKETYRLKQILKETILMVDISGYALSSQFNPEHSLNYASRIKIAEKYDIPFYIMPQSFGPFDYEPSIQEEMDRLIGNSLRYPKVVYAREQEGYELLKKRYDLKNNLRFSMDSVLLNQEINLRNVFKEVPELRKFPEVSGIAIIPNMKNFAHGNTNDIMDTYQVIIDYLIKQNKKVYIVRHSYEDIAACEMIKEQYKTEESVVLIKDDMSCLDFDELVTQFDFIIGSRFHSIVHAYKNAVPSIAIGWATKYHELLEAFDQSDYIFDVRSKINKKDLIKKIGKMQNQYEKESNKIEERLTEIQSYNPYDSIE